MAEENQYQEQANFQTIRIRDVEEKQRLIKDRILLIGKNLIETKEKNNQEFLKLKQEVEIMKISIEKIKNFIENISEEMTKFARKEDFEILAKQAKMFQPLEFVRKSEL
jgi:hypothetical protein